MEKKYTVIGTAAAVMALLPGSCEENIFYEFYGYFVSTKGY